VSLNAKLSGIASNTDVFVIGKSPTLNRLFRHGRLRRILTPFLFTKEFGALMADTRHVALKSMES
jgi:hypothetical protein